MTADCNSPSSLNEAQQKLCSAISASDIEIFKTAANSRIFELTGKITSVTEAKQSAATTLVNIFASFFIFYTDSTSTTLKVDPYFCNSVLDGSSTLSPGLPMSDCSKGQTLNSYFAKNKEEIKTILSDKITALNTAIGPDILVPLGQTSENSPFQPDTYAGIANYDSDSGIQTNPGIQIFNFQQQFFTIAKKIEDILGPSLTWIPATWHDTKGQAWTSNYKDGEDPRCDQTYMYGNGGSIPGRIKKCEAFPSLIKPLDTSQGGQKCDNNIPPALKVGDYPTFLNSTIGVVACSTGVKRPDFDTNFPIWSPYLNQVKKIPDPKKPRAYISAIVSMGHGVFTGKCGAVALIRFCQLGYGKCMQDTSKYKYAINFQTGVRSASFEITGMLHLTNDPSGVCSLFDAIELDWDTAIKYLTDG